MSTSSSRSSTNPFLSPLRPPSQRLHDFAPGDQLVEGRYEIRGQVGGGHWCAVYRASDKYRDLDVAIKAPWAESGDFQRACRILEHEFRMNARIDGHPNIAQVCELHYISQGSEEFPITIMELIAGPSYRHWLSHSAGQQDQRVNQGVPFMIQACQGLMALHQQKVVHLDLTPQNLRFTRNGVLKILDLGAAQCLSAPNMTDEGKYRELWHGTAAYMSPEQFMARDPSDAGVGSDIYALGCILYETISEDCRPPFEGTYEELREQHLHSTPPPLRNVAPELARIVAQCLAKSVSRRSSARFVHQQASDGLFGQFRRGSAAPDFAYVSSTPSWRSDNGSV